MNLGEARADAENLLARIITNQPELIVAANGHRHIDGAAVAKFCSEFVDTYSSYLIGRDKSAR